MSANYFDSVTYEDDNDLVGEFHPEPDYLSTWTEIDAAYERRQRIENMRKLPARVRDFHVRKLIILKPNDLLIGVKDDVKGAKTVWTKFESIEKMRMSYASRVRLYKSREQDFRYWIPQN